MQGNPTRQKASNLQSMRVTALHELSAAIHADGTVRVGVGGDDWFGAGRLVTALHTQNVAPLTSETFTDDLGTATSVVVADGDVRCSVRAYTDRALIVFRIEATTDLHATATSAFEQPTVGWPTFTPAERIPDATPPGLAAVVYQHCEFAMPAVVDEQLDNFFLLPHRPPTGWPLALHAPGKPTLLLAPIDNFHDQTIGLNNGTLRVGWHGDLDEIPQGFATEFGVFAASDVRHALDTWGALLQTRARTVRPGRWSDALASRPSYWTDNGAAYWYRTEPGADVATSIVAAVDDLRANDVAVGAVQLDSWFYPHVDLRPFDTDEWLVPPSAMTAWEERTDALPAGIGDLRARLGNPPLVAHIRHLSSQAPITRDVPVFTDGPYAVPATAQGYERWLDQCVQWGVETFEHDWLVEVFYGVRPLRAVPGRARAWQEGIDKAARARGITLQWCMATPADFAQSVTLTQVTSVRTCGDHGYIATPGQLWAWFCVTNALARSLGLAPFKDVFRTDPEIAGETGQIEALLSALSTGPVGVGDRVGRSVPSLIAPTSRADGFLIKPDAPIAATAATITANSAFMPVLHVAETHSDHDLGRWHYVLAMHTNPAPAPVTGTIALPDLGVGATDNGVIVWDWRDATATRHRSDASWEVSLDHQDWRYVVVAPIVGDAFAVIGDVTRYVPAGDARVEISARDGDPTGARLIVKGAGESVTITGWAAHAPHASVGAIDYWPATGIWELTVHVNVRGWESVDVSLDAIDPVAAHTPHNSSDP